VGAAVAAMFVSHAWAVAAACAAGVVALNLDFYLMCMNRRSVAFAIAACVLHFAFFIYSSLTFACVVGHSLLTGARRPASCSAISLPASPSDCSPVRGELAEPVSLQSAG
jgi:hypothetical protein